MKRKTLNAILVYAAVFAWFLFIYWIDGGEFKRCDGLAVIIIAGTIIGGMAAGLTYFIKELTI